MIKHKQIDKKLYSELCSNCKIDYISAYYTSSYHGLLGVKMIQVPGLTVSLFTLLHHKIADELYDSLKEFYD